jgi:hypothetical protein
MLPRRRRIAKGRALVTIPDKGSRPEPQDKRWCKKRLSGKPFSASNRHVYVGSRLIAAIECLER